MGKVDLNQIGLKAVYSFDQLVVGPNNHVAAAACHAVADAPGSAYNPLFIYGPPGVGKTHLMHAVAQQMIKANPDCHIKYISAERFMHEIMDAMTSDRLTTVRQNYSNLDLLILDDVQYLIESKVSQEEFFHIFNNLQNENRQVILAADRPPNQLTALNQNIRSRLEWGLASDVKYPDQPQRLEILKKKQLLQNITLTEEMLAFVAEQLSSNVRELEGFLKRIHAYTTLSHQQITMDLVQAVVREIGPNVATPVNGGPQEPPAPPETPKNKFKPQPTEDTPMSAHQKNVNELKKILEESGLTNGKHKDPAPPPPAARAPAPPPPPPAARAPAPPPAPPAHPAPPPVPAHPARAPAPPPPPIPNTLNMPPRPAPPAPAAQPPAAPPPPPPAVVVEAPASISIPDFEEALQEELPAGHKEVIAVFFYPKGCAEALETVHRKFQDVIKKHKLKFRLKRVHSEGYEIKGKVNYSSFVEVCKANKVPVAIVIGPPPETFIPEQDFYDLLTVTLDVQGVSLQLINWTEINKDYRYLNLALDIALVRTR